ncbi:MAG: NAD(P)H-dependent oxidoreductase subunit E [Bacteroidetes bacterium]|nr:NAD(P)H-dependent oxidoreductase subunit E [Bacteroidota bacterium]
MNDIEKNKRREFVSELMNKYVPDRTSLLPILQDFQEKFGYIDEYSQQLIAFELDIHPVEVNSVISFYAFLYDKPVGRNIVRICKNIVCEFNGSKEISDAVIKEFKINPGETTPDGKLTFEHVNCFGLCDKSPSMMVNGEIFENINKESALKIIKELK